MVEHFYTQQRHKITQIRRESCYFLMLLSISFAFGVVDEKESHEKKLQQDEFQNHLSSKLEQLDQQISELSAIIETQKNLMGTSQPNIKKNHWFWSILFG